MPSRGRSAGRCQGAYADVSAILPRQPRPPGRVRAASARASGVLQDADEVAVRVLDRGDQPAAAHVLDVLIHLRAGLEQRLQRAFDIGDVVVDDGTALVAVRVKTDGASLNTRCISA